MRANKNSAVELQYLNSFFEHFYLILHSVTNLQFLMQTNNTNVDIFEQLVVFLLGYSRTKVENESRFSCLSQKSQQYPKYLGQQEIKVDIQPQISSHIFICTICVLDAKTTGVPWKNAEVHARGLWQGGLPNPIFSFTLNTNICAKLFAFSLTTEIGQTPSSFGHETQSWEGSERRVFTDRSRAERDAGAPAAESCQNRQAKKKKKAFGEISQKCFKFPKKKKKAKKLLASPVCLRIGCRPANPRTRKSKKRQHGAFRHSQIYPPRIGQNAYSVLLKLIKHASVTDARSSWLGRGRALMDSAFVHVAARHATCWTAFAGLSAAAAAAAAARPERPLCGWMPDHLQVVSVLPQPGGVKVTQQGKRVLACGYNRMHLRGESQVLSRSTH